MYALTAFAASSDTGPGAAAIAMSSIACTGCTSRADEARNASLAPRRSSSVVMRSRRVGDRKQRAGA